MVNLPLERGVAGRFTSKRWRPLTRPLLSFFTLQNTLHQVQVSFSGLQKNPVFLEAGDHGFEP